MNIDFTKRITPTQLQARAFDDGDHWQNGSAFLPFMNLKASQQADQQTQMQNSLETENVIAEVLDNEQNAMFGRQADWQVIGETDADEQFAKDTSIAAVSYWDDYNLEAILKEANRRAGTQSRAVIRAFVPKGLITGNDKKSDLRSAMDLIRFEVLPADKAGVFLDEDSYQKYGLLKKQTKDNKDYTELVYVENGETVVKITERTNWAGLADDTLPSLKAMMPDDKTTTDATSFDLGGELLYFEIERKPLITDSIISNQKDVNLCLTMKNRLTYQAAYRDFFFFNTEQPVDKDGNPATIKTGGKNANFLIGQNVYDKTGENVTGYANSSMTVVDPASTEYVVKSKESSAFAIYNQTSQVHLTKVESADASGISKRESRFSFEKHCTGLKQIIDPAGRWMLKVLILFAADNLGQSEKYKRLRIDFNCRIDAGAPDAQEIAQASLDVTAGKLSDETYISKYLRFDDADAEKTRLESSESYQIAIWDKRLATALAQKEMGLPASEWIKTLYPNDEDEQARVLPLLVEPAAPPSESLVTKM